jgi:short-subunit dehydrogenase
MRAKTVIVTGATSGLGQELVKAFAKRGFHVIGIGLRDYQPQAQEFNAIDTYIQADFRDPESACNQIQERLQGEEVDQIDVLIHNAATGYYGDFSEQTTASIEAILNVNLVMPILLTNALLPCLQQSQILFLSSIVSGFSMPKCLVYAATKSALDSFAVNLKTELSSYAEVSLCPLGAMRTPMHQRVGFLVDAKRSDRFADPARVAEKIEQAVTRRQAFRPPLKDRLILSVGTALRVARLFAAMAPRIIPRENIKPGQRVAITGAAQGIGLALAKAFAQKQCALVLIDKNREGLQQAKSVLDEITRGEIILLNCDLSELPHVTELNNAWKKIPGGIDLVIHNAGINHAGIFGLQKGPPLLKTLKVNLFAPLLMTHHLIHHGLINEGGCVVFVSSLSHYVGYPGSCVYAATKDAVQSLAASLGRSPFGLKTATLFPGPTDTAQARDNAPLGGVEDRSENRMDPARVASEVVCALKHRRSLIIPGFANRVMAFFGVLFPGMMRRAVESLLFRKMIFEQLNVQIQNPRTEPKQPERKPSL